MTPRPKVLVVEDDGLIRLLATDLLEDAGYDVFGAEDAATALAVLADHPDFVAVFTDVDMPGSMDGLAFAATVRERRPWVGLVITSGKYAVPRDELPIGSSFIRKPYSRDDLVYQIGEAIAG